jgi:hypothetical protein
MTESYSRRLDVLRGRPVDVRVLDQRIPVQQHALRHRNVSSASGTLTLDLGQANSFSCTLSENVTTVDVNGPMRDNEHWFFYLELVQDTTNRTVTWASAYRFPGGTDHTMTTGSGSVDRLYGVTIDGGTTWDVVFWSDFQ